MTRLVRCLGVCLIALVMAACGDEQLEGPGPLPAVVEGTRPLGAVVLDVTVDGYVDVTGRGGDEAYNVGPVGPTTYRIVVVSRSGGALRFQVEVRDRAIDEPVYTVVEAVDTDDVAIRSVAGIRVRPE